MRIGLPQQSPTYRMFRITGAAVYSSEDCVGLVWPVASVDASFDQAARSFSSSTRKTDLYAIGPHNDEYPVGALVMAARDVNRWWIIESFCHTPENHAGCPICDPAPAQYQVTIDGVTDGTCDCGQMNGTFLLTNTSLITAPPFRSACVGDSTSCRWISHEGMEGCSGCSDCCPLWALSLYNVFAPTTVLFGGLQSVAAAPLYTLPVDQWNCFGANTLTRTGSLGPECNNWPSTVIVRPA